MSATNTATQATAQSWVSGFLEQVAQSGAALAAAVDAPPTAMRSVQVRPECWAQAVGQAAGQGCRCAAFWGDEVDEGLRAWLLLEMAGHYLALTTTVPASAPNLASATQSFPCVSRLERHAHDLLGLCFAGHIDPRPWTRHRAWRPDVFPLRHDFIENAQLQASTPADTEYPFVRIRGSGVHEIPVGPVHAGIIEPGHFRFQAVGENILFLEERLGYAHKGIEKRARGMPVDTVVHLAGRVSGDTTVSHAWAACQAIERGLDASLPPRALVLRAILAERERVANHLGDIGAVANDVGFAFANYQFSRLRENWQRSNAALFGHRLLMDSVVPGGVAVDLNADAVARLVGEHAHLRGELLKLFDILTDHPPLDDRLLNTGHLPADTARELATLGYVARASGQTFDVRKDSPYAPYDRYAVTVPVLHEGDVSARLQVRMGEVQTALDLLDRFLAELPPGPKHLPLPTARAAEGIGCVEGWRGEIVTYVRLDQAGRVARFFPRDPSWFNWPALERLIAGNLVPDFPVCNKSVNGSYSGHDL